MLASAKFSRFLIETTVAAMLCLMVGAAVAQTYAYRSDTFAWDAPSASATTVAWAGTCTGYPQGDDDFAVVNLPAGFSFTFAGTAYTQVRVLSNGMLQFGADAGFHRVYTNQALPITAAPGAYATGCANAVPQNLILGYWRDIVTAPGHSPAGPVKYELLGSAPNRRFVVTWQAVGLYASGGATIFYSFQVALNEDGTFKYQYTTGSSDGTGATVGVQVSTTDYTQYAYNQAFIDPANGTAIKWYPASEAPAKAAEYRMDEGAWNGTAGEVHDVSGNNYHGVRVGTATTVAPPTPYNYCRAGSFSGNVSAATQDAVSVPISPQVLGSAGSVMFWYNGTAAWNDGNNRVLLDATQASAYPFFLVKLGTGKLRLAVSDSAGAVRSVDSTTSYTFAANTWHHVAATWSLRAGTNQTVLQIFVDGALAIFQRSTTTGAWPAGANAPLNFYIGDNRSNTVTPANGTGNGANGMIDEVNFYNFDIGQPQANAGFKAPARASCSSLDHFSISHSGSGTTCSPASVTFTALDASLNPVVLTGTTANITTSTNNGNWLKVSGNNLVTNNGNGSATYVFSNESFFVLGFTDTVAETVNFNINSGGVTENTGGLAGTDPNMVVTSCAPSAMNAVDVGANSVTGTIGTKAAGTAFSLDLYALNAAKTATDTTINGSILVDLLANAATGVALDANKCPVTSTALAVGTATLASGKATFAMGSIANAWRDVRVRMRYPATGTATVTACSADDFAVRPSAVTLTTTANAVAPGLVSPTVKAASAFTLGASTAPTSYGGTLALDATKLTAQITTQATTQQSGGTVGTLSPASLTANAGVSGNAAYTEAGYLYLGAGAWRDDNFTVVDQGNGDCITAAADAVNYLSDTLVGGKYGCAVGNKSAVALGRFIPDHFVVTFTTTAPNNIAPGCGNFTYFGQDGVRTPFALTAQNSASPNTITQNYSGAYVRFATTSYASYNFSASGLPTGATLASSGGATAPSGTWTNGVGSVSATHVISRPSAATPPASIVFSAAPTDADGVTAVATPINNATTFDYGRVRLLNANGSELLDLPMTMRSEYWKDASSGWQYNSADTCTIATLAFTAVATPDITTKSCGRDTRSPGNSGKGCGTAGSLARQYKDAAGGSFIGDFNLWLKAPGVGNSGAIDVSATVPAWLQYNWTGTVGNPKARATFGVYKSGPVIFRRESY